MKKYKEDIEIALSFHDNNPFDAVHDKRHHERVVENAIKIVNFERVSDDVDKKLLYVSSAIHDAIDEKRDDVSEQVSVVKKFLLSKFDPPFVDKVIECISNHSFGKDQKSLEQQVLYDADKLDYSSKTRFEEALDAVNNGKMSMDRLKYYFGLWKERVGDVPKSMHFKSSKKEFSKRTKDVLSWLEKNFPEYHSLLESC